MFFRVQVLEGPGSGCRVQGRVQVLEVAILDESLLYSANPAGNYMVKVNNRNTRTRCEKCSKLTLKTPE